MNNKDSSQDFGLHSDVLAEDRALDMLGQGQGFDDSDPLFALLSDAKAQADANIPSPPLLAELLGNPAEVDAPGSAEAVDLNVIPLRKRRRKLARRGAGAAVAAGGTSITTMLVAGGVAAALAVGGLSYAAYSTSQPDSSRSQESAEGSDSAQTGTDGLATSGEASRASAKPEATDKDKPPAESAASRESEPTKPASETAPATEVPSASEVTDAPVPTSIVVQPPNGTEGIDSGEGIGDTTGAQPAPTDTAGTNDGIGADGGSPDSQSGASVSPSDKQQSDSPLQQGEASFDHAPAGSTDTRR